MDFGRISCEGSPLDGLESFTRGVAVILGCRGRVGGSVRAVACVRLEFVRGTSAVFVRGVVDVGPPSASHARSNAERSRCPCSATR